MYLLLGSPGSGKSTQCQWLADHFNLEVIATGKLLRQGASELVDEQLRTGQLADSDFVLELFRSEIDRLTTAGAGDRILFDGSPRKPPEAAWMVENYGDRLRQVWIIQLAEAASQLRLSARQRSDDQPELIAKRRADFKRNIDQIAMTFLTARIPLVYLNADQPPDRIRQRLQETFIDIA